MNTKSLQEHIKKVLREENFIPLEDLNTVIKDYEGGFDVFIMNGDKKIGEISFVKENLPDLYTIVDATIDDEYKGNRIYPKTIINLFKERPNIIINSVFRSPEAEKAWRYILSNLPSNIGKSVKYYKEEDTTLYQLKLRNIQESIRRILREENKKSSLLSNIQENGLYDIIANTGLHVNEVEQKVGQLSREVLERFIKDVVKEHFQVIDDDGKTYIIYLEDYPYDVVPVDNSDYVEQLRVTNNELFFWVTLYEEDEYGDLEEQSYEIVSPKNLLYANIYEIAGQLGFHLSKGSI